MGDIKKKRKLFSRPKQLFDRTRMDEENVLIKKYGLKNKREIWKAKSTVSKFRKRAKTLIGSDIETQKEFFDKLNRMGLGIGDVSDVLALTEENLLDRRLQTMAFKKKLANTVKQARQLIVHKNVLVDGNVVNSPSFLVTKDLEDKISIKERKAKAPKAEAKVSEEVPSEEGKEEVAPAETEKVEEEKVEESKSEEAALPSVPSEEGK
ncbi:30S ribosomal protein S4 [archaeon]|nr:30S ribosomal protein S4 [archaeon]MBT6819767.1 30S ribosomal protein S4 [archaeon]MBT6956451.1 30S ribosomal protein S4 [archaeon]